MACRLIMIDGFQAGLDSFCRSRSSVACSGAKPCDGWPITINPMDNGFPHKGWVLDAVRLMRRDLCLQVIRENAGEIVYTVRLTGYPITLRVFEEGAYSIRLFDPDGTFDETQHGQWTRPPAV